jgi:DNA polymerase-3 subunit delta
MMSEYQVVIVKEAQNIKNTDALAAYVEKPLASTILVMCHKNGTLDKRKTLASKIQKNGVLFESKKLGEKELPAFIERYLKQHTATIDTKSTQMIVEAIGADLSRLTSELDKLLIALPENDKNVTPQVVENQIGVSKDFNAFELKAALVNRDVYKANQIIQYFDENPKSGGPFKLVPLLFSYFQNLMMAYYAPNPKSQEDVAGWLELKNVWAAKEYMTGMRNYSGMKVMQIIGKLRETDAKMKGLDNPNTDQGDLMKELIFYILH